jgi:hypothetical protein
MTYNIEEFYKMEEIYHLVTQKITIYDFHDDLIWRPERTVPRWSEMNRVGMMVDISCI